MGENESERLREGSRRRKKERRKGQGVSSKARSDASGFSPFFVESHSLLVH